MCGRYWLVTPLDVLSSRFRVRGEKIPLRPRWNAAPGQDLPVVRLDAREKGSRVLEPMRWGLVPSWAASPEDAGRPINARAETAAAKPTFEEPFRRRRGLVPGDGFFEWKTGDRGRQPYAIRLKSREPFAFAGLWDEWRPRQGPALRSFAILTTRPNAPVAEIHDRMPVILTPAGEEVWLDAGARPADLSKLFEPLEGSLFETFPVSRRVNAVANDDPSVLEPPEDRPPRPAKERQGPPEQRDLWENDDDGGADG